MKLDSKFYFYGFFPDHFKKSNTKHKSCIQHSFQLIFNVPKRSIEEVYTCRSYL